MQTSNGGSTRRSRRGRGRGTSDLFEERKRRAREAELRRREEGERDEGRRRLFTPDAQIESLVRGAAAGPDLRVIDVADPEQRPTFAPLVRRGDPSLFAIPTAGNAALSALQLQARQPTERGARAGLAAGGFAANAPQLMPLLSNLAGSEAVKNLREIAKGFDIDPTDLPQLEGLNEKERAALLEYARGRGQNWNEESVTDQALLTEAQRDRSGWGQRLLTNTPSSIGKTLQGVPMGGLMLGSAFANALMGDLDPAKQIGGGMVDYYKDTLSSPQAFADAFVDSPAETLVNVVLPAKGLTGGAGARLARGGLLGKGAKGFMAQERKPIVVSNPDKLVTRTDPEDFVARAKELAELERIAAVYARRQRRAGLDMDEVTGQAKADALAAKRGDVRFTLTGTATSGGKVTRGERIAALDARDALDAALPGELTAAYRSGRSPGPGRNKGREPMRRAGELEDVRMFLRTERERVGGSEPPTLESISKHAEALAPVAADLRTLAAEIQKRRERLIERTQEAMARLDLPESPTRRKGHITPAAKAKAQKLVDTAPDRLDSMDAQLAKTKRELETVTTASDRMMPLDETLVQPHETDWYAATQPNRNVEIGPDFLSPLDNRDIFNRLIQRGYSKGVLERDTRWGRSKRDKLLTRATRERTNILENKLGFSLQEEALMKFHEQKGHASEAEIIAAQHALGQGVKPSDMVKLYDLMEADHFNEGSMGDKTGAPFTRDPSETPKENRSRKRKSEIAHHLKRIRAHREFWKKVVEKTDDGRSEGSMAAYAASKELAETLREEPLTSMGFLDKDVAAKRKYLVQDYMAERGIVPKNPRRELGDEVWDKLDAETQAEMMRGYESLGGVALDPFFTPHTTGGVSFGNFLKKTTMTPEQSLMGKIGKENQLQLLRQGRINLDVNNTLGQYAMPGRLISRLAALSDAVQRYGKPKLAGEITYSPEFVYLRVGGRVGGDMRIEGKDQLPLDQQFQETVRTAVGRIEEEDGTLVDPDTFMDQLLWQPGMVPNPGEKVIAMPRPVWDELRQKKRTINFDTRVGRNLERSSDLLRYSLLGLRPAYMPTNMASTGILGAFGGVGPVSFYRAAKGDIPTPDRLGAGGTYTGSTKRTIQRGKSGEGTFGRATDAIFRERLRGPVTSEGVASRLARAPARGAYLGATKLADTTLGTMARFESLMKRALWIRKGLPEARKIVAARGGDTALFNRGLSITDDVIAEMKRGAEEFDLGTTSGQTVQPWVLRTGEHVSRFLGLFEGRGNRALRTLVPFSPWFTFILSQVFKELPIHHPVRLALLNQIGALGNETLDGLGFIQNDVRGGIPVTNPDDEGNMWFMRTPAWQPWSTVGDLFPQVQGSDIPDVRRTAFGALTPYVGSFFAAVTGQDIETGDSLYDRFGQQLPRALREPGSYPRVLANRLWNSAPQGTLALSQRGMSAEYVPLFDDIFGLGQELPERIGPTGSRVPYQQPGRPFWARLLGYTTGMQLVQKNQALANLQQLSHMRVPGSGEESLIELLKQIRGRAAGEIPETVRVNEKEKQPAGSGGFGGSGFGGGGFGGNSFGGSGFGG